MIDWGNASTEDIIRKYMELSGGPVTPNAGGQLFQRMKDWGANFVAQNNRQPTREEWANFAAMAGGITPEQALSIYDQGVRYNQLTGQWAGEDMFNQLLYQTVPGYGQTPTLGREEFQENRRQFDTTQGNWSRQFDEAARQYNAGATGYLGDTPTMTREQMQFQQGTVFPWEQDKFNRNFGENQRQFDVSTKNQQEQFNANLLSGLSGPRDAVKYEMAKAGLQGKVPGSLAEAFGMQPTFGTVPNSPEDSWEGAFEKYWQQSRNAPANTTPAQSPVAANPSVELPARRPSVSPSPQVATAPAVVPTGMQAPGSQMSGKARTTTPAQNGAPVAGRPNLGPRPAVQTQGQGIGGANDMWARSRQPAGVAPQVGGGAPNVGPKPAVQPGMQPGLGGGMTTAPQPTQQLTPEQQSNLDLLKQLGLRQATDINAREYYNMTPARRALQEAGWAYQNKRPEDMWQQTRAALPKGQANTRIRWG